MAAHARREEGTPWRTAALIGLGSFASGATAPLYDSLVTPSLEDLLGSSAASGAVMGLDNLMALLLTPLVGAWSDRTRTRLGRRVPFVLTGLPLAALAFAAIPFGYVARSLAALLAAVLAYNLANCCMRAPLQALLADLVPSQARSRVAGVMSVFMCIGAMIVLGAAKPLAASDARLPFALSAVLLLCVFVVFALRLREPPEAHADYVDPERLGLRGIGVLRQADPMMVRFFLAVTFFYCGFQSLSTWFTTYGAERYHVEPAECTRAFIVLAISNLLASVPAGFAGSRFGRRRMAVLGVTGMALASAGLHGADTLGASLPWITFFGVSWSCALVNLLPMALELGGRERAGTFAGALFFCHSLAGMLGPWLCGQVFDAAGDKRPLFVLIGISLAIAGLLLATLRRGYAESPIRPQHPAHASAESR